MKSTKRKKGAIQLSLGFIVTIVFAVVLLSLAIVWVRGMFESFDVVTQDMTRQAKDQLAKVFSETTTNFAVRPGSPEISRGTELTVQAGIKNDDPEGRRLNFVVNVGAGSTNTDTSKETMKEWITQGGATSAGTGQIAYRDIVITVPSDAKTGSYLFDVYACWAESGTEMNPSDCTITSGNLWGTPQTLTVIVKPA